MDKETQLSIAISLLMQELNLDEYIITKDKLDELKNSDYIGLKIYKENDVVIVKKTKQQDITLKEYLLLLYRNLTNDDK